MTIMQSEMLSLHLDGLTVDEISDRTGMHRSSVFRTLLDARQKGVLGFRPVVTVKRCPLFDSCRNCTFGRCRLDEFLEVTLV